MEEGDQMGKERRRGDRYAMESIITDGNGNEWRLELCICVHTVCLQVLGGHAHTHTHGASIQSALGCE